jgi:transcription elongation factor Elf1
MPSDADIESTEVPIVCPACETTTRVPISELVDTVDAHNDRLHDGDEVASVDPELADHLVDLVADDLLDE